MPNWLTRGAFWAWAAMLFVAATSLMAAHVYALPKPAGSEMPAVERALGGLRSAADQRRWMAVHVLYARCRCSRRLLDHLALSSRPEGAREKVLLVGSLPELEPTLDTIALRGFEIVRTTPAELRDRYHVQAAPLLFVLAPDGRIRHTGGYTDRKQGLAPRDAQIITTEMSRRHAPELPPYGCAVSTELRQVLDPLGLSTPTDRTTP